MLDQENGLVQAIQSEQMGGDQGGGLLGRGGVVCPAHGDSRMGAIFQLDDEVRVWASPDANNLDLLTIKWVIGTNDGYESRRREG